eukprot:CAMPEP_0182466368 /NCGR_PEP_ID=MMETSP1319-20130603/11894_1 /TAXON_ID=172717 /ORGANISM="Bolidomonas pacifica, Strain RCC208" /LENGTH=102 /DNA_ID=CAMNT_0024666351 /DNA_START=174 /DNA_END=478 /DNA_ORIENTATION=+
MSPPSTPPSPSLSTAKARLIEARMQSEYVSMSSCSFGQDDTARDSSLQAGSLGKKEAAAAPAEANKPDGRENTPPSAGVGGEVSVGRYAGADDAIKMAYDLG